MIFPGQVRQWSYTVHRMGTKNFLVVSRYIDERLEKAMQTRLWNILSEYGDNQVVSEDFIEKYSSEIRNG